MIQVIDDYLHVKNIQHPGFSVSKYQVSPAFET